MSRAPFALGTAVFIAVITVAVVVATPSTPVPVIDDKGFVYAEAERTLGEVGKMLEVDPELSVDSFEDEYPLLVAIEGREPAGVLWGMAAVAVAAMGYLAERWSRNRYGLVLVALAITLALWGLGRSIADLSVRSAVPETLAQFAYAVADASWIPVGVFFGPLLILTFPNGRLVSQSWRWVLWLAGLSSTLLMVQLASPRRYDGRALATFVGFGAEDLERWFTVGLFGWMLALVMATASLLVRYFRAEMRERQQLKWVVYGLCVSVVLLAISDLGQRFGGDPVFWGPIGSLGFFVVLPVCLLLSVFRYGLWGVDLVISKSVVFAITATGVGVVYVSSILAVGLLVGDQVATALAMLTTAALIEPLYGAGVGLVEQLVYRRPSDPERSLSEASSVLQGAADIDVGLQALADGLAEAMHAEVVAIWLDGSVEPRVVAPRGVSPISLDDADNLLAIEGAGLLGVQMPRGDRLRRRERARVMNVATMASALVGNAKLRDELVVRATELESRQASLKAAQTRLEQLVENARADVERDLHDGAQARAVALSAAVGLARATGRADVTELVGRIDAVGDAIWAFANGVYPYRLATSGLEASLEEVASKAPSDVHVVVEIGQTPSDVVTAAYFVALEGMANAMKHAPGAAVRVLVAGELGLLRVKVEDDGPGIQSAASLPGRGLASIRERVEALGGEMSVGNRGRTGVTIEASIPVATGVVT